MRKSFKKFINEKIENVKSSPSGDPFAFLSQDKFVRKGRIIRKRGQYRTAAQNLTQGIKGQSEIDAAADAIRDMKNSGKMGKITTDVKQAASDLKNKMFTADGGKKITTVVRDTSGKTIANPPITTNKITSGQTTNVGGGIVTDKDLRDASKIKNPEKFADTKGQTQPETKPKPKQNVVKKKGPSTQYRQLQNKARGILKDLAKEKTAGKNVIKPKLDFDLTGNKIDDSVRSVRTNRRTINKVYQPNVTRGSGSGIVANKGGSTTVKSPQYDINRKKVQSLKNIKPVKRSVVDKLMFGDVDKPPTTTISKKYVSPLKNTKPQTTTIPTDGGKSGVEKILRDVNKQQPNKITPGKGFSQFRTDSITRRGIKPTKATSILGQIAKNPAARKATKALGVIGTVADAGITFADTYKKSQQKGDTKQRSIGKGLSRVAGGAIGGTLGALAAAPIPIPGARVAGAVGGYQYGKKLGGQAFDTLTTMRGRDKLKQSFSNFRKKAMRPAGS